MKTATFVVAVVAASILLAAVPTVNAHTCSAYEGCDAGGCKEGEDHEHTDMNRWPARDEYCTSEKDPPPPPPTPCVPAILCSIQERLEQLLGPLTGATTLDA